jgi:hypothetical protein
MKNSRTACQVPIYGIPGQEMSPAAPAPRSNELANPADSPFQAASHAEREYLA